MIRSLILLITFFSCTGHASQNNDSFDDRAYGRDIIYPDWFKDSFLNLKDDHEDAIQSGKKGIAVYFGQKHCAYCEALMRNVLGTPDINDYFKENFDVIALDIWGNREITLVDGEKLDEREFAVLEDTNFTPSLLFYGEEGELIFRMRGYYKPYRFRAMLKYLAEGFYKKETFLDYMDRAQPAPKFDDIPLNPHPLFSQFLPILDRRSLAAQKPLAIIFEQPNCHACDQLHSTPLNDEINFKLLKDFEIHQLNTSLESPIMTPLGELKTASNWAKELNIHYFPSILFFDQSGAEIMRIESLVKLYRLRGVLQYLASEGYKKYSTFQRWRRYTKDFR